jgi:hypothetical protein
MTDAEPEKVAERLTLAAMEGYYRVPSGDIKVSLTQREVLDAASLIRSLVKERDALQRTKDKFDDWYQNSEI